uniref:Uncharacterized protein n=1 Tax=Xenopus tropicalis TaxID=8364 RepID=A0A1B8Y3A2_XENTR
MVYRLYSPLIVPAPPYLHLVQTFSTPTNGIPLYSHFIYHTPTSPLGTDLLYPNQWYTGFTLHSLYQHPHISTWYRPTLPQPMVYRLYSPLIVPAPPHLHLVQTYSTPTNGIPALLSTHSTSTPTSPLGTDLLYPNQWYTGFTLHS